MVPASILSRADTKEQADLLHCDFDVVPYPRRGEITGYFIRDSRDLRPIDTKVLLSHGTPIIDLPQIFLSRPFSFIIATHRIAGYLHYSDLNKPMARVPFFAAFQMAEGTIWERIQERISDELLRNHLEKKRFDQLARLKKKRKRGNADLGWQGVLSLPDIIRIGRRLHQARLTDEEVVLLKEYRNRTAHANKQLIESEGDIRSLCQVVSLALKLARSA
jgi:hypothetical protein